MRLLLTLSLLPLWVASGVAQTAVAAYGERVDLTADKLVRTDNVLRGQGRVRAKLGALTILADEGALRVDTGEFQLRGHVVVNLPAREDHSLFRCGDSSVVTDRAVIVHADELNLKSGLLHAAGNILIRIVDAEPREMSEIKGDEMSMSLKTADATVRGNVHTNEVQPIHPGMARSWVFPPEVILK